MILVKRHILFTVLRNEHSRFESRGHSLLTNARIKHVTRLQANRKWLPAPTSKICWLLMTYGNCEHVLLCRVNNKRHIVTSGPFLKLPETSCLTDYIFDPAQSYCDETALIDYDTKESLSFAQLQEEIQYLSSNLLRHEIGHSDVITYFGTNSVELIQLLCAANRLGAIVSLANAQLTSDELQLQLRISKTKMLVTTRECAAVAKLAATSLEIKPPFVIGTADGCQPFSYLKERCHKLNIPRRNPLENDVALIPFSSGTTGMPKGVQLSNKNLIAEIHGLRHHSFIPLVPAKDVSICALPMVHIAGLVIGCLNALAQGAATVLLSKFSPPAFLSAIQDYMGTFTLIAPPIMNMLAKDPIACKYDLSSIATLYSGAAPLNKTLTEMVSERLGIDCIRQGYGMTETSPATHTSPLEGWKYGSVGVPLPNTHCKVVNVDNGAELGPNEEGELWLRGPQVMLGYHDNEKATRHAFSPDGNWLKTGDIGYFDDDGHYFISDRIKDVIKYKGYQIAPAYLESVLLSHSNIRDAAVVGTMGADNEEVPLAWVVVKDRISVTDGEIHAFVNERVAPYKRLRGGVRFVDEIPKSASGKILKRIIREKDSPLQSS